MWAHRHAPPSYILPHKGGGGRKRCPIRCLNPAVEAHALRGRTFGWGWIWGAQSYARAALPGKDVALSSRQTSLTGKEIFPSKYPLAPNNGGSMPKDKGQQETNHDKVHDLEQFRED